MQSTHSPNIGEILKIRGRRNRNAAGALKIQIFHFLVPKTDFGTKYGLKIMKIRVGLGSERRRRLKISVFSVFGAKN